MSYKRFINNRLHRVVQKKIVSLIGEDEVYLEYRFKGHIADIYWKRKNIVFEVQCSKMSLEECKKRTSDFESLGIKVVWILHQKNFNKNSLSPMESYLKTYKNRYYTNITQTGEGIVFDQEELIYYGIRRIRSAPLKICLSSPISHNKTVTFKGDLNSLGYYQRITLFPSIWKEKWKLKKEIFRRKSLYYYKLLKWNIKM